MTFPLTKTGRENLEAILAEFERAGRHYPPLYHERLVAWSESGEVRLSDAQWQAFIDAESNDFGDSEWSEWDGPHPAYPGFIGTYLGRWYGDPDGIPEFFNLVESLTAVLEREDFSTVDDLDLPFAFGSWIEWISTIHSWAFRFQMPLLSCEMSLWGAEDANQDDFYELSEQLSQTGDVSWPLHPVRWSLTYNVFTSSAAAIRAILRPEAVIGANEPWPTDTPGTPQPPIDEGGVVAASCHRLVFGITGWCLRLADSDRPFFTRYQAGLHRIAALVENRGVPITAEDLYKLGGRNFPKGRPTRKRSDVDDGETLTDRKNLRLNDQDIDKEGAADIEEQLRQLSVDLNVATLENDDNKLNRLKEQMEFIKKNYFVTEDGKVVPRPFRDRQAKRDYDAVRGSVTDTLSDLQRQLPGQVGAIKELEDQLVFDNRQFKFEPKPGHTPWRVERQT